MCVVVVVLAADATYAHAHAHTQVPDWLRREISADNEEWAPRRAEYIRQRGILHYAVHHTFGAEVKGEVKGQVSRASTTIADLTQATFDAMVSPGSCSPRVVDVLHSAFQELKAKGFTIDRVRLVRWDPQSIM